MVIDGLTGKMSAIKMLFRGAIPGGLLKAVASADGTLTLTHSHQLPLLEFSQRYPRTYHIALVRLLKIVFRTPCMICSETTDRSRSRSKSHYHHQ